MDNIQQKKSSKLVFFVNGKKIEVENVDPKWTLLWYIRQELQLTGSKLSCGQGGCGACTVMISSVNRITSQLHHYTVNACIYPLVCTHGKAVTTVEGIGRTRTALHPVQERLAKCHGTQCGFCSPGMVMSMYTLLRNTTKPTEKQIEEAIQGNLCRCTGYRPILDSFKTFTDDVDCPLGETCCRNDRNRNNENNTPQKLIYDVSSFKPLNEAQEIIFPSELQMTDNYDNDSLLFNKNDTYWLRPKTMKEAIELMKSLPDCEWAMGHTINRCSLLRKQNIISVGHLQELNRIITTNKLIEIGSGTTLSELQKYLSNFQVKISDNQSYKLITESLLSTFTNWLSGSQVKNVATIGGNVLSGGSTSNFIPMLMILQAEAVFADGDNEYVFKINNDFTNNIRSISTDHLLTKIRIPVIDDELIGYYYASQQTHLAGRSSIISAVFRANINSSNELCSLSCAYGGLLKYPLIYDNVIKDRQWNKEVIQTFNSWFQHTLSQDVEDKEYEQNVAFGLFTKFFDDVEGSLQQGIRNGVISLSDCLHHHANGIHVWESQTNRKSVGQPIPTQWAMEHVTGEAKFVMDMPQFRDELHMILVTSSKAHANIVSIDTTKALDIPGVVDFICHKDIPGKNILLPGFAEDEEIFATKKVCHIHQTIGGVIAETEEAAVKGAAAVIIEYEELPAIFTIKEAIKEKSFLFPERHIEHGDVTKGFKNSVHVLTGEIEFGGKDHYYMETQSSIAVPKREYSQLDIYSSTAFQQMVQDSTSSALGIAKHKINIHTKRVGGAFGGKSSRSQLVAVPVSIAAYKHNKPVRLTMDRALDISSTGGRHPCYAKYKVGFDNEGRIVAYDCDLYLDGGDTTDVTHLVISELLVRSDNCFNIPNARVTGNGCKTNLPSNTGFRGFGSPKGIHIPNLCVERIANHLNLPVHQVYEVNLYKDGDLTITNEVMKNCTIRKCWELLKTSSEYVEKKAMIAQYNKHHYNKKKGIAMTPAKYDFTFGGAQFMNQGAALINIYTDGSVLIHHGGIEVGQGLNVKMIQIASETLGVHHSKVIIDEASTNAVPNTIPTASSSATDLYGGAVKNACDKLNERLQSLRDRKPKATWEELVNAAFFERVPLSATGYYKPANIWYNHDTNEGNMATYYTYGAACSEVEVDIHTGEHKLVQTDIVFDIGKSINPAIDIGQIEGGFLQGYGFYCLEELMYSSSGELLTNGPSSYRVPTVRDIPHKLNITLLKDNPHEKAVYSSKGIGEPPLLLASSVYFAIKEAIKSVRKDHCLSEDFQLNCPTTPKRILHAFKN